MQTPITTALLFLLSAIGLFDAVYFHILVCKLRLHPSARWENVLHVGHSASFAAVSLLLMADASGVYWWLYPAVALFQIINQTVDTLLEPISRRPMGGIPETEYRLHGVINFLWGGVLTALMFETWHLKGAADAFTWRLLDLPLGLWLFPFAAIAGSVVMASVDGLGAARLFITAGGKRNTLAVA